ncbi:MAG: NnrS protein involved in response to NO [Rhodanobacteraceae bacterium]|nr:MAG: NnrS protein involved in response to NO [Rhodanobacteraceae bacterium]
MRGLPTNRKPMATIAQTTVDSPAPPLHPFRPLFFCSALAASLGMLAWGAFLHFGWLPSAALANPFYWHAHIMLYGFGGALVGGFLLTAAANWTGIATTTRRGLWLLTATWVIARVLLLTPLPFWIGALFDVGYLFGLAFLIGRVLWLSRNKRNAFLILILLFYAGLDIAFYAGLLAGNDTVSTRALLGTVDLLTVLMLTIGGRVIPFFTSRKLAGHTTWTHKYLIWAVNGGGALVLLCGLCGAPDRPRGALMLIVAALAVVRLVGWRGWRAWREPMLWVLHVAYLWLAIGLVVRGLALLGVYAMPEIDTLHGLTVGALGTLSLGMMTRVAQGHSGVPIQSNAALTVMFVLPTVAAAVRLCHNQPGGWVWAAALWFVAYTIYLLAIGPLLVRGRVASATMR